MKSIKAAVSFIVAIFLFFSFLFSVFAKDWMLSYNNKTVRYSGSVYSLKINGENVKTLVPCINVEGTAYVPLREVFGKELGAIIRWNDKEQVASAALNNRKIEFSTKDSRIYLNGDLYALQKPIVNIDGSILVPLRITAEYLGFKIGFDSSTNTVLISSSVLKPADTPNPINKSKSITGDISLIEYGKNSNNEYVKFTTTSTEVYKHFLLMPNADYKNYRLCIQISNALIPSYGKFDVNSGLVVQVRYAQADFKKKIASLVIETSEKPFYSINTSLKMITVYLKKGSPLKRASTPVPTLTPFPTPTPIPPPTPMPTLTPTPTPTPTPIPEKSYEKIKYESNGSVGVFTIRGVNLAQMKRNNDNKLKMEYRKLEKTLRITLEGYIKDFENKVLPASDNLINGIIVISNKSTRQVSFKISGKNDLKFKLEDEGTDNTKLYIYKAQDVLSVGNIVVTTKHIIPKPTSTPTPVPTESPLPTPLSLSEKDENVTDRGGILRDSTVQIRTYEEGIEISAAKLNGYKIFRLTNPERIVIDLPGNIVNSREITDSKCKLIKKIRTGQFKTSSARVVLETLGQSDWVETVSGNKLKVGIKINTIKRFLYHNDGQDIYIKLFGVNIQKNFQKVKDKMLYENDDKTYTIVFPFSFIDLGTGKLSINDVYTKALSVFSDKVSDKTYMVFDKQSNEVSYSLENGSRSNELIFKMSKTNADSFKNVLQIPENAKGKIIMIDPGHGGSEPGATKGIHPEKWYNLDIALRVKNILKNYGINVQMTRETDTFMSLYARAKKANTMGVDLFVSIHCNSSDDQTLGGTSTYYYPTSYKGKKIATLIQGKLIENLKTVNEGVKSAHYVVLRATRMPAVLVEVAYLSNNQDLAKLNTESFRQKAAEAIAEGIIASIPNL